MDAAVWKVLKILYSETQYNYYWILYKEKRNSPEDLQKSHQVTAGMMASSPLIILISVT
jgi:hypothetical protein